MNTSAGVTYLDPQGQAPQKVQTADILEPEPEGTMRYLDDEEPEIVHVVAATGWVATFEDGHAEPLVVWVVLDDGEMHGVAIKDGKIDLMNSIEDEDGFARYVQQQQIKES